MIISASYKTDIPTFYGEWFLKRLTEGYCGIAQPYSARVRRVSLRREDVDGIVFWTKNGVPFVNGLQRVHELRYPFVLQHTVNGYPRELEHRVVHSERSVALLHDVAKRYGQRVAVWRYDTIIMSSITDSDYHRATFARLAGALEGATDEVVVSFVQSYRKTVAGLNAAAARHGFTWWNPSDEEKRSLVQGLAAEAASRGMRLTMCGQPELLAEGVGEARCIDADRLSDIAGKPIVASLGGSRRSCGCYQATDIGSYDTCPHGCVYCYAVSSEALAQQRYKEHDAASPYLDPSVTTPLPDADRDQAKQLTLW